MNMMLPLLCILLCVSFCFSQGDGSADLVLRWSSTGGGWRSMVATMAFSNVFARAGLITDDSSSFSGISTNSGSSWFAVQLFYSPIFFNRTINSTPTELGDFVSQWMQSYKSVVANIPANPFCDRTDNDPLLLEQVMNGQCDLFLYFGGDWANFTHAMLEQAASDYGDAGFADRAASFENRVQALQATDMMIQMDLAANSRIPRDNSTNDGQDTMVYLGPSSLDNQVYTVPMAVQYTVSSELVEFRKAADDILSVYNGPAPSNFSLQDYEPFFLFPPPENASLTIDSSMVIGGATRAGTMREPFLGSAVPTVNQVAGPSSAAVGGFSGLVPTLMAQLTSLGEYWIEADNSTDSLSKQFILNYYLMSIEKLYNQATAFEVSVCSQWPEPCTDLDARFVDGGYTDGSSLALNVGKYQQSGDINKLMKVVLTNTNNNESGSHSSFLAYFSNPMNAGVEPGSYIWPSASSPMQSLQIFDTYLDEDLLGNLLEPIEGTNLRTAVVSATTIDNTAYGVVAGQQVELLLIDLNTDIPTIILGADDVDEYTRPLSRMAETIASNDELVARVQAFAAPIEGEAETSDVNLVKYQLLGLISPVAVCLAAIFWY